MADSFATPRCLRRCRFGTDDPVLSFRPHTQFHLDADSSTDQCQAVHVLFVILPLCFVCCTKPSDDLFAPARSSLVGPDPSIFFPNAKLVVSPSQPEYLLLLQEDLKLHPLLLN